MRKPNNPIEIAISAHVGRRLRLARKVAGIDDELFAARLGIHRSMLGRMENGNVLLTAPRLFRAAAILNRSTDWFFEEMSLGTGRRL